MDTHTQKHRHTHSNHSVFHRLAFQGRSKHTLPAERGSNLKSLTTTHTQNIQADRHTKYYPKKKLSHKQSSNILSKCNRVKE